MKEEKFSMKKKDLNDLAKKIAAAEKIIQTSDNKNEISKAEDQIMKLSCRVKSLTDMTIIDELVQDILSKELDN